MAPIYVAFDGDNDRWAYAFMRGWKTNDRVDFDFEDAHDLDTMTGAAQSEQYVKSKLRERMNKSSALVVIVGEKTKYLHKYVKWEIELAFALGLPIIVANLNNTNGLDSERCPTILRTACAVHVPFKKDAIKHALASWPTEWRTLDASAKAQGHRYYNRQWN